MSLLARLREASVIDAVDSELALTLGRAAGEKNELALLALALTSSRARGGHVCVDLQSLAGVAARAEDGSLVGVDYPELPEWRRALLTSGLVGDGPSPTPLVLAGDRKLYLRRHFQDERALASSLTALARDAPPTRVPAGVRDLAARLYGGAANGPDRQRLSAELAVLSRLTIVTGGPGTGKTTAVAGMLALLAMNARVGGAPFRVRLLAPTGKAAARLTEAVTRAVAGLDCPQDLRSTIPVEARTIHRGLEAGRGGFRISRERPLLADVVIVDEASMVDLGLMRRLVEAIPRTGRLVLLGDPHQLASVEAGAVLSDVVGSDERPRYSAGRAHELQTAFGEELPREWITPDATPIDDGIVRLVTSHRFSESSALGRLARAVQRGDSPRALECFREGSEVELLEPRGSSPASRVEALAVEGYGPSCKSATAEAALAELGAFRVLCAHREGILGVSGMNRIVRQALESAGLIRPGRGFREPVMIRENDSALDLANGDVGVVFAESSGESRVCVPAKGGTRLLSLARLPPHEPAFAMSIHKSQGSEWATVLVVLPDGRSPLLSRELLYTAITRARRRLVVHGSPAVVARAIEQRVSRASGLGELLRGQPREQ